MDNQMLRALKRARPWLALVSQDNGRPDTSDIHAVLAEVDAAIASDSGRRAEGARPKGARSEGRQSGDSKAGASPIPLINPKEAHTPIA